MEDATQQRTKIELEYLLKCSPKFIFKYLSTPSGLNDWYAENVSIKDNVMHFQWGSDETYGKLVANKPYALVKFEWQNEFEEEYLEFKLKEDDLTGDLQLKITDFCDQGNETEAEELWNIAIQALRQRTGA